jgi:hypothetical protein
MDLQHEPVRHIISKLNPLLIESWCLKCGVFIAASSDIRKLQAAEGSHPCLIATGRQESPPRADRAAQHP